MSKKNPKINIAMVIDRSGSMHGPLLKDHIGGIQSFVKEQQNQAGKTKFTFVQFDSHDPFQLVHDNTNINKILPEDLDLIPRGNTPLLDAVGKTIAHVEEKEKKKKSDQVIVMIVTDGYENCSTEWKKADIAHLIKEKENDGWQFMFLGAGVDAFMDGQQMGLNSNSVINVANNSVNIRNSYSNLTSDKIKKARGLIRRGATSTDVHASMCYTSNDNDAAGVDNKHLS